LKLFKKKHKKTGYLVHQSATKYALCKILNEYTDKDQAKEDLIKLLTKKITEEDLLDRFDTKKSW